MTLVEDKMHSSSFNKCPIYTHDSASAKFNTNSHETDNSEDSIPSAHVAWRTGTINRVAVPARQAKYCRLAESIT
jgi:hypothetical protein